MTKGILVFAYNNADIDYVKQAAFLAGRAKEYLNLPVSIVTDEKSIGDRYKGWFDKIIISDIITASSKKKYYNGAEQSTVLEFKNDKRPFAYDLSPYDETLVIDADYFIMNDILDQVWDSDNDVMINCKYRDVSGRHKENIEYIDNFSIPMYWATVVYFKKSDFAENLFTLVSHIKYNYKYYYYLYNCSGNLFRNDFAFSMALHILNGSVAFDVPSLPIEYLNNSFDLDDIYRVNSHNDIIMYCADAERITNHLLSRFKNVDIHIMNKKAIARCINDLLANGEKV